MHLTNPRFVGKLLTPKRYYHKTSLPDGDAQEGADDQEETQTPLRRPKKRKGRRRTVSEGQTSQGSESMPPPPKRTPKPRKMSKQDSYDQDVLEARLLMKSCYFKDDISKRIDFVLVTTTKICADFEKNQEVHSFLRALIDVGVQMEIEFGQSLEEYFFIKIHVPENCLTHLANLYHVELSCANLNYNIEKKPKLKFYRTELHKYEESGLVERAPITSNCTCFDNKVAILTGRMRRDVEDKFRLIFAVEGQLPNDKVVKESVSGARPTVASNAERAMLLHRLMMETRYGPGPKMYGLESLRNRGLLVANYMLHEGTYKWTRKGPLSDRQLLAQYWANFRMLFKKQPLSLVEKYFGTELGMYFAWLEFYVKYLIPAALVGVVSFLLGSVNTYITERQQITTEVCESKILMCPYCEHYSLCPFTPLKDACSFSRFGFLLDNYATVFFSMFMSVWATVFMVMWRRRLSILKLRWNVYHLSVEETVRQDFLQKATAERVSEATGEVEPYIPTLKHCTHFVLTNATVMFCALVIFSVALSVIVYQYKLRYIANISKDQTASRNASWTASITGSIFIGLSIMVFTVIYEKVAYWLTKMECPRTQQMFDKAFIVKNCLLNFSNNYAAITYLAFFKGKFFTYPGATHQWNILGGITTDLCGPAGCLADVGIQLAIVLIIPSFFSCLAQIVQPYLSAKLKRMGNSYYRDDLPQWEADYYLLDTYKYYLFNEYRDLLIQYGYITCFVCALPLAPLLALIRNVFEIRIDATKFLKYHKRHIACKVDSLGAYEEILYWITYASVVTNACVIAFSSNFIPRAIYRLHQRGNLKGYVNNSLSVFDTNDYENPPGNFTTNVSRCYYHGMRYPPDHPRKYALREDYFYQLVGQLAFVLVFEHIIVLINVLLVSLSRDKPRFVRDKLRLQEYIARDARMKALSDSYRKSFSQLFAKSITLPKK